MRDKNIFYGVITALVTPFKENKIDFIALKALIDRQIAFGIKSLVIAGSTAEGHSLTSDEYYELVKNSVLIANGRINIIAAVSTVSTSEALNKVSVVEPMGVNGLMCTVPHYIIPTQQGIYEHFYQIHQNSKLPIIIYIHPKRTGIDVTDSIIYKLAALERIFGIKDAGNDIERPLRITSNISNYTENFNLLTGNDNNVVAYTSHGGRGVISVISNLLPKLMKQLYNSCYINDFNSALKLQHKLIPVYDAVFAENNPIGIKTALKIFDLCQDDVRLPLIKGSKAACDNIKKINFTKLENFVFK